MQHNILTLRKCDTTKSIGRGRKTEMEKKEHGKYMKENVEKRNLRRLVKEKNDTEGKEKKKQKAEENEERRSSGMRSRRKLKTRRKMEDREEEGEERL
jgi:hypothetical protein